MERKGEDKKGEERREFKRIRKRKKEKIKGE